MCRINNKKNLFVIFICLCVFLSATLYAVDTNKAYHLASEIDFSGGISSNMRVLGRLFANEICMNTICRNFSTVKTSTEALQICPVGKTPTYIYFNGVDVPNGFSAEYPVTSQYYDHEDAFLNIIINENLQNPTSVEDTCDGDVENKYYYPNDCTPEQSTTNSCYDVQHIVDGNVLTGSVISGFATFPLGVTGRALFEANEGGETAYEWEEGDSEGEITYEPDVVSDNDVLEPGEQEAPEDVVVSAADLFEFGTDNRDALNLYKTHIRQQVAAQAAASYEARREAAEGDPDLIASLTSQQTATDNAVSATDATSTPASYDYSLTTEEYFDLYYVPLPTNEEATSTDTETYKGIFNSVANVIKAKVYEDAVAISIDPNDPTYVFEWVADHTMTSDEIGTFATPEDYLAATDFFVDNGIPNAIYNYNGKTYYGGDYTGLNAFDDECTSDSDLRTLVIDKLRAEFPDASPADLETAATELISEAASQAYFDTPTVLAGVNTGNSYNQDEISVGDDGTILFDPVEGDEPGTSNYYQKVTSTQVCRRRATIRCI